MKLINKILFFLFLAVGTIYKAQDNPDIPPAPPVEASGVGPGGISSPIDMYIYVLAAVAILLIAFYKKTKQKNIA